MEIKSLEGIDFNAIYKAFEQAFADYEMQQNKEQLRTMLKRRGFNPDLSFAAFDKGEIVAFTFNGTGNFNGEPTAYDTGTGTLKEYRGQGLATKIFECSIPYLRKANIKQYLLEVLQHNTKAVSIYRKLGFEVTREFNYFIQETSEIKDEIQTPGFPYLVKPIIIEEHESIPSFWDFLPSWQNSFESIERTLNNFICLGAFSSKGLVGYCVFEPSSGDVTQIAVDRNFRRKGIASFLFGEIIKSNRHASIKIINTDVGCDSITGFLKAKNIDMKGKQFEMIKAI